MRDMARWLVQNGPCCPGSGRGPTLPCGTGVEGHDRRGTARSIGWVAWSSTWRRNFFHCPHRPRNILEKPAAGGKKNPCSILPLVQSDRMRISSPGKGSSPRFLASNQWNSNRSQDPCRGHPPKPPATRKLASVDDPRSHMYPTGNKRLRDGWAPGADTDGPQVGWGEGCARAGLHDAGGVWEAREALPRVDGGVMGSMAPAQDRRRRLLALPRRSATDTPARDAVAWNLSVPSIFPCPHHAARQPGR